MVGGARRTWPPPVPAGRPAAACIPTYMTTTPPGATCCGERGYVETPHWGMFRRLRPGWTRLARSRSPPGYTLRRPAGTGGRQRWRHPHAAFGRTAHTAGRVPRLHLYCPVVRRDLDLVARHRAGDSAPTPGLFWDPANRRGVFEPVCTLPRSRHRGPGITLMQEGVRRLRDLGQRTPMWRPATWRRPTGFMKRSVHRGLHRPLWRRPGPPERRPLPFFRHAALPRSGAPAPLRPPGEQPALAAEHPDRFPVGDGPGPALLGNRRARHPRRSGGHLPRRPPGTAHRRPRRVWTSTGRRCVASIRLPLRPGRGYPLRAGGARPTALGGCWPPSPVPAEPRPETGPGWRSWRRGSPVSVRRTGCSWVVPRPAPSPLSTGQPGRVANLGRPL